MTVPFVGRAEELAALRGLISRARRDGSPCAALISGEPGTGKSRLLREATADLDSRRCVVLTGFEPTQPVPLAAASDLLRRLVAVPGDGARLEALVFGPGEDPGRGALPVFEAAHRALGALGPLVVAVDDLQWIDEQSLGLLTYLLKAAESTRRPLAVIAAARPSLAELNFAGAAMAVLPVSRRAVIELGGLPRDAGVELARAIDDRLDERTAGDLWLRAAGSPFWLEALAHGHASPDGGHLATDRLRSVSSDGAALLNILALGARPFGREQLTEIAGWPEARLDQAVRELAARALAVEAFGAVRLAHDLIREAVAATTSAATRQVLHRRLAELLERWAGPDLQLLAEAIDHRLAAGLPTGELAARMLRSPQRRLLGVDGLRRLASIADAAGPGSVDQQLLDKEIGELASVLGDQGLALRHWLRLAEHDGTAGGRHRAAWEAALAAFRLGRAAGAHAHLDRARREAPPTSETLARIEALHAEIALWLDHDTMAGAAAAHRSLAAAREVVAAAGGLDHVAGAPRQTYVTALEASIGAAMQEERFDDVRRLTGEILPAAQPLGEEAYVAALLRSGFALQPLGAIETAEAMYREAWDIAHRAVLPFPMIDAGIGLARALRDLGRLEEARTIALETLDLETRLGSPPGRWGDAGATLHAAELSLGEPDGLERVRADARVHPNPHFRLWLHQLVAVWQARLDGPRSDAAVQASLDAGRRDAALAGCPRCGGELTVASAEALARIGRIDEARRELEAWEARGVADYPWQEMLRIRAEASIAVADGNRPAGIALLGRLREALEDASLLDELVWAHLDLGDVWSVIDRDAAVEAYTAAARMAESIGAVSRARLATRALRRLGVRAWRRGPATVAGETEHRLSERERQVAGLVAGGATNLEVAALLAISPRTVERHVANILAKVGARNRTELAARLGITGKQFHR
jgi:DNA-binding CsgD family transcriptional regulator